ncbi:S8 family serine peptidase [Solihabitans fulvus]|uniref:S8 family serine peptidase n=1 Tax=Solihabitans fulvus TaxID=1892852 RepID=A0A5B2XTG8_9PSEU|nr:S8 family serine peptidase [Solihabitans fulvus]KAA2266465.1 S8 family serine peptidase [Solihabitans fulvus]
MRTPAALAAVALTLAALAAPPSAGSASAASCAAPEPADTSKIETAPWPQRLLAPKGIWPMSEGNGQLVAVIGTGVDGANAQFGPDQVRPPISAGQEAAEVGDCDGRGTFAAGIVAAKEDPSTTFTGVAPRAQLLPVRYVQSTGGSSQGGGDPTALASAITKARTAGATVLLVVVPATSVNDALRDAVKQALAAGAVIVSPAVGAEAGVQSYPTQLPGVIGVGAIKEDGTPVQLEGGDTILVAAPGDDLTSTSAGAAGQFGRRAHVRNPAFAAAYVAGTVALMRSYRQLRPEDVADRLARTAAHPPGGGHDPRLGWGTLNAYAAVSAELPPAQPVAAKPVPQQGIAPAAAPVVAAGEGRLAGILTVLGLVLAVAIGFAAAALRRGRARGWRSGRLG